MRAVDSAGHTDDLSVKLHLPEVSDWLTKLLLGAGLVQLTHLGRPVGQLIVSVARGLYDPGTTPATAMVPGSAKVLAGSILFGYLGIGILSGYVVTASWYRRKLNGLPRNRRIRSITSLTQSG